MAGEVATDPVIQEATAALRQGAGVRAGSASEIFAANAELGSLHELIGHRLFQILVGQHKGRVFNL